VETLIEAKVRSIEEWTWKKQLRFYMGRDNVATVAMVDASFYYTYEYQGNAPKLVNRFENNFTGKRASLVEGGSGI